MPTPAVPFEVHPLLHPSGCRSYVVVDPESRDAIVVDPVLDQVGEVLRVVSARRASLRAVVDTHTHGDHLSGAAALHQRTGAEIVMSLSAESRIATRRVSEGDELPLGSQVLRVRAAPGVSTDHIVLQGPLVLFTGDALLVGTIGVHDAPGADGGAAYDTIQRLFEGLPDETVVHPGHDDMGRSRSTIKAEKRGNRWMREKDRDNFLVRWAADPRIVPKNAPEILAANREGTTESSAGLETAGEREAPPTNAGPVVAPPGMGAAATGGLVPEGIAQLLLGAGLLCIAGCVLAILVHPMWSLLCGLVGVGGVALGLSGLARRSRKKATGLYYLGPQPRTPMR